MPHLRSVARNTRAVMCIYVGAGNCVPCRLISALPGGGASPLLLILDRYIVVLFINQDARARRHFAEEELFGEGLLDFRLNQTRHRPCAEQAVEAATGEPGARAFRQFDGHLFVRELRPQLVDEFVYDALDDLEA